jgi:ABC-type multidrug transport system ATPase subunit
MTGGDDVSVIDVIELTARRHGRKVLDEVGFQVRPGQVTGLLGLPGSGKTTVLRRMLQLEPGGGRTFYDGRPFRSLPHPIREVGVVLDPLAVNPGRTAAGHLKLALSADPGAAPGGRRERIAAVLDVCGLGDQARTRICELTEGMTVRLAIAQALLGDPQALLLDEPEYGLEPEGLAWLDAMLRAYAAQGRCVLVTGQNTEAMVGRADRVLLLDEGRLVGQRTARQVARELSGDSVIVRTPQVLRFAAVLVSAGAEPTQLDGACLEVQGLDRARIGDLAFRNEIPLHELSVRSMADDPVVSVLEACRRPASVVPVQAPATARVPDHARAKVAMPFLGGGAAKRAAESGSGTATATATETRESQSSAESALLSIMEMSRSATDAPSTPAEPREPVGNVRVRETAMSASETGGVAATAASSSGAVPAAAATSVPGVANVPTTTVASPHSAATADRTATDQEGMR